MSGHFSPSVASTGDLLSDPEAFMRELNRPSVTVETLQQHRQRVQAEADEINVALKKNVYKNYALFIDSAKMISLLKNEMYTLSRLLSNQQNLMSQLTEVAIGGDRTHGLTLNEKKEVAAKYRNMSEAAPSAISHASSNRNLSQQIEQLKQVIDRIEGCSGILETRNRSLLTHGELTELDPNDYKKMGRTLAVLLNDCFILAQAFPFPSRQGKKYKFQSLFELDSIAVVNVKDAGYRSAFKILMFPQTKVFEAESTESKNKWLDSFDAAKRTRRESLSLQRRGSVMFSSMEAAQQQLGLGRDPQQGKKLMSPADRTVYSFDEELEDVSESESEMIPNWLQEFPDDMDVLLAQRNFEDAVTLVLKVNDHLVLYPKCYEGFFQNDLRLRVNHKIQELVDCISNELHGSTDRSLQHGPRAARRAVQLLLRLGKASLATKLFLAQRSCILKFTLKQQLLAEASALPFIAKLCRSFVNHLIETCRDFENAFNRPLASHTPSTSQPASLTDNRHDSILSNNSTNGEVRPVVTNYPPSYPTSCLIAWCQKETLSFISTFSRNVFLPSVPMQTVCESVSLLRHEINRLRNLMGLDFLFFVDKLLKEDVVRAIDDCRTRLTDQMKNHFRSEEWQPQNFKTKQALHKFLDEVKEPALIRSIQSYVFDECKLSLSTSTCFFTSHFVAMTADLMKLSTPFTHQQVVKSLLKIMKLFIDHLDACLKVENSRREFIRRNASFLLDHVVERVDSLYQAKTGSKFRELRAMRQDFEYLKLESGEKSRRDSNHWSGSKSTTSPSPLPEKKRSPSKSTVSISEGKITSTITYL